MFKVLVIAYYYPPLGLSGVQRTLKFTKYFKDFNWSPTVITTGKIGYFAYDENLLAEAESAGIEIIRTEAFNPNSMLKKKGIVTMPSTWLMKLLGRISKTFFIPDNKKYWALKAAKEAKKELAKNKYDAIYISVPPFSSIMPIVKLKDKFDIPIFVDYRDSWLLNQFRFYPTPYHRYKHKKIEDKVLRKIDRVIVVNRIIKENLLKNYQFLKFKDIDIIPHGYDQADFDNCIPLPKENTKMIITYAGIFYEDITPKYLLQAFKQLSLEEPDIAANIELHFVGHFKKENRKLVKKLKLESFVREIGYLSHNEVIRRITSSDVLWLMLPNKIRMQNVSPGKLFEYFGARKPIIASLPEGIARNAAKEYGASYLTLPDSIDQLKTTLFNVHKDFIDNNFPIFDKLYVENHNRKVQADRLIKIFQFYLKSE
ncbi:MAG: glycosyltransferase [Melioribacteraceae bacterium]|nr:glycosyltransferase [Melioribacteraceae bacterium]